MALVACNRNGNRLGEFHQNCRYTDHEVDKVLELRDLGYSYRQIARMMEMPISTVYAICQGIIRSELPDHWEEK